MKRLPYFSLQLPVNIFDDEFEAYDEVEGHANDDTEWAVSFQAEVS